MSKRIFNTVTEYSTRLLALLELLGKPASLDRLFLMDYISVNPRVCKLDIESLHGVSAYRASEIALQRKMVSEAIKYLFSKGLIKLDTDSSKGFRYLITPEGRKVEVMIDNQYLSIYKRNAKEVSEKVGDATVVELLKMVRDSSNEEES